jgi:hypothetical protein
MRQVVLVLALAGCFGQIEATGGHGGEAPDAGPASGADAATDAAGFACRPRVATVGSGNHHAGEDCQGSCHNHGFTLAGTIFAPAGTTTPLVGATITVVDATGRTVDVVSQRNGNFYTSQRLTFPVRVTASLCPNITAMAGQVTASMDGCNAGGCHVAGAQGGIHLP